MHSQSDVKDLAWAEGLRGAVGIAIPIAIGLFVNHLVWGILCAFATLWILMCDVGGAYRAEVEGSVIGLLIGQFAAPSGRGEVDADQYGGDGDQEDNGHIRIVPCSPRDVARTAGLNA